jgi:hypothetical protein
MPLRLIDTSQPIVLTFEDTEVRLKVLTNGQVSKLATLIGQSNGDMELTFDHIAPFVEIVGVPKEMTAQTLKLIENEQTQIGIITALMKRNRLSEVEEKNFGSSSAGSALGSRAGDPSTATSAEMKTLADALSSEAASLAP